MSTTRSSGTGSPRWTREAHLRSGRDQAGITTAPVAAASRRMPVAMSKVSPSLHAIEDAGRGGPRPRSRGSAPLAGARAPPGARSGRRRWADPPARGAVRRSMYLPVDGRSAKGRFAPRQPAAPHPQPVAEKDQRAEMQKGQGDRPAPGVGRVQSLEALHRQWSVHRPRYEPIRPEAQQPREVHAQFALATSTRPTRTGSRLVAEYP